MLVEIDADTASLFQMAGERAEHGVHRRYYVAAEPHLMILVTRDMPLATCVGRVCDCALGWHEGQYGFVRPGNQGRRHSKLTIYKPVKGKGSKTLAQILKAAPKESGERPQPGKA